MVDPGWYHADGDPVGTVRYWTGANWQGAPTTDADSSDVIYYAEAPSVELDLGDIATRTSPTAAVANTSQQASPYSINATSVNVKRRKRVPEGLKNLTVLVSVFKAMPLVFIVSSFVRESSKVAVERRLPRGLSLDSNFTLATTLITMLVVIGFLLIVAQVRAALRDQASTLTNIALLMVIIDLVTAVPIFAAVSNGTHPSQALPITAVLLLQTGVFLWAVLLTRNN